VTIAGEGLQILSRPIHGAFGLWADSAFFFLFYCETHALTGDFDFVKFSHIHTVNKYLFAPTLFPDSSVIKWFVVIDIRDRLVLF
jgi:hypothetical protein